jgi:chromosomal replication initiation ATPase DnaA
MTPTYPEILRAVLVETGVTLDELFPSHPLGMGYHRHAHVVAARRALCHLCYTLCGMSYPEIAAATTGRGHSSWVEAGNRAREMLDPESERNDLDFRMMVARITRRINDAAWIQE